MARVMGYYKRDDYPARLQYRKAFVCVLTIVPASLFWIFREPVNMVFIGGMAQFLMMPVIGIGTLYLRHRHLPKDVAPSTGRTIWLWVSSLVLVGFVAIYLVTLR